MDVAPRMGEPTFTATSSHTGADYEGQPSTPLKRALDTAERTAELVTNACRKRRAVEHHSSVRQPAFEPATENDKQEVEQGWICDGEHMSAVETAFAAFVAKHQMDLKHFRGAEWSALIDALHGRDRSSRNS